MSTPRALATGTAYALAAGLMWGLVFLSPTLLPDYAPVMLSVGRYVAFGLIALPLALLDLPRLRQLSRADWIVAAQLGLVGNLVYYACLAAAIQAAGGALPTMIIGTLPVVIAVCSNLRPGHRDGRLRWRALAGPLLIMAAGIACVNHTELEALRQDPQADLTRYAQGVLLALVALACWTWYPIRNADWLREHPDRSPTTWATAQGLVTGPMALLAGAAWWAFQPAAGAGSEAAAWLGPRPGAYLGLMLLIAFSASWLGTLCWNRASQRLPTALVGPLIVFETLAALAYTFLWRGQWPAPWTALGIVLLIVGVAAALRLRPEPTATAEAPH